MSVSPPGPVTKGEFQELKAELSELPAPAKVRENAQNNTGLENSSVHFKRFKYKFKYNLNLIM